MSPSLPIDPGAVAGKARDVLAKVRPGPLEGRRSLPIDRDPEEIRALWAKADARLAVLDEVPVEDATLEFGPGKPDWGTTVTVSVKLSAPVPGMAAQTYAGKVVRRLKALAETGEVPTTAFNPSARPDAGEASGDSQPTDTQGATT
jgi:hypothetical protein